MIKVYIAGGWKFRDEAREIQEMVRSEPNLCVTSTWVDREVTGMCPAKMSHAAKLDIEEVKEADVVLAIMKDNAYAYRGTFSEIGCALGQRKHVIIVCPGSYSLQMSANKDSLAPHFSHCCMTNVFFWHPEVLHAKTVKAALLILSTFEKSTVNA